MPFSERVEELDREIRSTVARALAELREDLAARLRRSHDEVLLHLEEVEPTLPAELLSLSELGPLASEEADTARRGAFAMLRDGLAALDGARSQAEVLAALLAESGRYASRALLLLTRAGELRGWGGNGFGDEAGVRALALPLPEAGPWATVAAGRGTVPLAALQCAELCSRLESELPRDGVLVPLMLRGRVAAALYADRTGGDELLLEPLQALVHAAAQAIETLPFRERGATATLRVAEAEEAAAAVAAPEAPPAVEGMIAAEAEPSVPEAAPEPEELAAEPEAAVPEVAEAEPEMAAAEPEAVAEPEVPAAEPEPWATATPWQGEPAIASTESEVVPAETGVWQFEPASEETVEPTAAPAPWTAPPPSSAVTQAAPVWGEAVEEDDTAAIAGLPLEDTAAETWRLEDEGGPAAAPAPEVIESWRSLPTAAWELPRYEAPPAEPTVEEAPPVPPAEAAETAPQPLAEGPAEAPPPQTQETVLLRGPVTEPVPSPYAEAPAAEAASPAETVRIPAVGSEVQPPVGVQGPGWAFATTRLPVGGEEAQHEEARRLARLLVSEIKLYNEEQVEEGRRSRDLYERLKEDIDRSRQMYEERVEASVLNTTDYFYQELVRILAAGDAKALGI